MTSAVSLLCAAGSAGDRLGHGEEGAGAQTRPHPAEGENSSATLTFTPWPPAHFTSLLLLFPPLSPRMQLLSVWITSRDFCCATGSKYRGTRQRNAVEFTENLENTHNCFILLWSYCIFCVFANFDKHMTNVCRQSSVCATLRQHLSLRQLTSAFIPFKIRWRVEPFTTEATITRLP